MTKKAERFNTGKPKLSFNLLSAEANIGEAKVWEFGANKYDRGNWLKGCPWTEAADSLQRHLSALLNGEDNDQETDLPHVDHITCCVKILAHSFHTRKDLDDRGGKLMSKEKSNTIKLTGAEIISNLSRQDWAEGLIKQLPNTHDGRNSWLLNYGTGIEAEKLRKKNNIKWDNKTNAAETVYSGENKS